MRRTLRVFVYRNLNNDSFSVRDVKTGLVICHSDVVFLKDAVFKVGEKARKRVAKTGNRTIHAGIEGDLILNPGIEWRHLCDVVTYDPFTMKTFALKHCGTPVYTADLCLLSYGRVFVNMARA